MESISFAPKGVCCKRMEIVIEDGVIRSVEFKGGCNGNLQGIARLVAGQKADDVAKLLRGVDCGGRGTSCPDQLAIALENR
ncbi:MAG: TIGR03905 family TSCPD domain-containing protein [Rikenellaceae bacterium]